MTSATWIGSDVNERSLTGIFVGLSILAMAIVGPYFASGWIGHGFYKIGLLVLPFAFGFRSSIPKFQPISRYHTSIISGLGLGAGGGFLLVQLIPMISDPLILREELDARYGLTPASAVITAILLITVNALLEEWFYRGCLDKMTGMTASAIFFGAQHTIVLWDIAGVTGAITAGVACFAAGICWSFQARDGIARPFYSHAAADIVLLAVGLNLLGYI